MQSIRLNADMVVVQPAGCNWASCCCALNAKRMYDTAVSIVRDFPLLGRSPRYNELSSRPPNENWLKIRNGPEIFHTYGHTAEVDSKSRNATQIIASRIDRDTIGAGWTEILRQFSYFFIVFYFYFFTVCQNCWTFSRI